MDLNTARSLPRRRIVTTIAWAMTTNPATTRKLVSSHGNDSISRSRCSSTGAWATVGGSPELAASRAPNASRSTPSARATRPRVVVSPPTPSASRSAIGTAAPQPASGASTTPAKTASPTTRSSCSSRVPCAVTVSPMRAPRLAIVRAPSTISPGPGGRPSTTSTGSSPFSELIPRVRIACPSTVTGVEVTRPTERTAGIVGQTRGGVARHLEVPDPAVRGGGGEDMVDAGHEHERADAGDRRQRHPDGCGPVRTARPTPGHREVDTTERSDR